MAYDPYRRPTEQRRFKNPLAPRRNSVAGAIANDQENYQRQQEDIARERERMDEESRKAQEQAAKDAQKAQEEAEAQRVRALAEKGAETKTDVETGKRTVDTHEDGAVKFKAGALGEPAQVGGKWTQKFRNDRGEETEVDIAADPNLHKVDEKTGEKWFETKDAYGKPQKVSLGYDEEKKKRIEVEQKFTREKALMAVEKDRQNIEAQALDTEALPVTREKEELGRVMDEHKKALQGMGLPSNVEMDRTTDGKLGYRHESGAVIPFPDDKVAAISEWKKRQDELVKREQETSARAREFQLRKDDLRKRQNDLQIRESKIEIERAKLEYPDIDDSVLGGMARPENAPALAETNAKMNAAVVAKDPGAVADLQVSERQDAKETAAVAKAGMKLKPRTEVILADMTPEQREVYEPAFRDYEANEGAEVEARKTALEEITTRIKPAMAAIGMTIEGKEQFGDLQTLELLTGKMQRDESGGIVLPDEAALQARMDANPEFWTEQRRGTALKALERVKNAATVLQKEGPAFNQAVASYNETALKATESYQKRMEQAGKTVERNMIDKLIGSRVTMDQAVGEKPSRLAEFGGVVVPNGTGYDLLDQDGMIHARMRPDGSGYPRVELNGLQNAAKIVAPDARSGVPVFLRYNKAAVSRDEFEGMLKSAIETGRMVAGAKQDTGIKTGYEKPAMQSQVAELIQARGLDIDSLLKKVDSGALSVQQGNALMTALHGTDIGKLFPDMERAGSEEHFSEFLRSRPDLTQDISGLGADKAKQNQLIDAYVSHLAQTNAKNPFFPPAVRQELRTRMQAKTPSNFWSVTVPETAAQAVASTAGIAVGLGKALWSGYKSIWGEDLSTDETKQATLIGAQTKTAQDTLRRNIANFGEGKDNGVEALRQVGLILDGRDSHDLTPEMEEEVKTLLGKAARQAVEGKAGIGEVGRAEDYDLWNNVRGRALLDEYIATGSDSAMQSMVQFLEKDEQSRLVEDAAQRWISSKATATGMDKKMQQAFFGGTVAPLQEFGTEIIGDALMFVGVGASTKAAQTAMKVESTRRAAQRAVSMAQKIKEGVNKARAATYFRAVPGKNLNVLQKAANIAQGVGRGAVKGGVVEGFEEMLAVTFSEVNPDSADFAKSFEEGFIGGVALAGGMSVIAAPIQAGMQIRDTRQAEQRNARANQEFADYYNTQVAKGDAALAITPEMAGAPRIVLGESAPRFARLMARQKKLQEAAGDTGRPIEDRAKAAVLAGRTNTQLLALEEATSAKVHLAVEASREIAASPRGAALQSVLKLASGANFTEADNAALGKLTLEGGFPVVEVVESVNEKGFTVREWRVTDEARAQISMESPALGQLIQTSESVKISEAKLEAAALQAAGLLNAEAGQEGGATPSVTVTTPRVPIAQTLQSGYDATANEVMSRIQSRFPNMVATTGVDLVIEKTNSVTNGVNTYGAGGGMLFWVNGPKGKPQISIHPEFVKVLSGMRTPDDMDSHADAAAEEEVIHLASWDSAARILGLDGISTPGAYQQAGEYLLQIAADVKATAPELWEQSAQLYMRDKGSQWDNDATGILELVRQIIQSKGGILPEELLMRRDPPARKLIAFFRSIIARLKEWAGADIAKTNPKLAELISATEARLKTYEGATTEGAQTNEQNLENQGQKPAQEATGATQAGMEPGETGPVAPQAAQNEGSPQVTTPEVSNDTQAPAAPPAPAQAVQYAADGTYRASTPRAGMSVTLARPGPVELDSIRSSAGTDLQPRDRSRPANRDQEQKLAANWNPARSAAVPTTDSGPIIYAADGQNLLNLSGHGRQNAQRILYSDPALKAKARENREWIKAEMGRLGYTAQEIAAVDGMKAPVWAARLVDLGDYARKFSDPTVAALAFVRDSNIYGMSPGELALSDAAILQRHQDGNLLMRLKVSDSGSYTLKQLGNDAVLSEILELFGAGNEYTDTTGKLTAQFEDRLDNAMLAVALGNQSAETITGLVEGQEGTINIRKAIITAAPDLAKLSVGGAFDIGKEIIGPALRELAGFRAARRAGSVEKLSQYLAQQDFTRVDDPRVSRILDAIADASRKPAALGELLVEISRDELRKKLEADAYGSGLFGPNATAARVESPAASIQALATFAGENSKPAQAYRALLPLIPSMPAELQSAVAKAALYEEGRIRNGAFTAGEFHQTQSDRLDPLAKEIHRFMDGATPQAAESLVRRFQFLKARQNSAPQATPSRADAGTMDLFGSIFPDQPAVKPRENAAKVASKAPAKGKRAIAAQIATTEQFSPEAADLFAMAAAGMIDNTPSTKQNTPNENASRPTRRPGLLELDQGDLFDLSGLRADSQQPGETGLDGGLDSPAAGPSDLGSGPGTASDGNLELPPGDGGQNQDPGSLPDGIRPEGADLAGPDGRGQRDPDTGAEGNGGQRGIPPVIPRPPVGDPARNAEIDSTRTYAPKAGKVRFEANIRAIRLMRDLEAEKRHATQEEKEILLAYTGWGWLKEAFNKARAQKWENQLEAIRGNYELLVERHEKGQGYYRPDHPGDFDAFVRNHRSFQLDSELRPLLSWADNYYDQYKALREALTPEEFDAAAKSVMNAHYTDVPVIGAMWDLVRRLGFKGGQATEPGAGIGHFIGAQPTDLADRTQWNAVELDGVTARILAHLYPEVNVNGFGPEPGRSVEGLGFQAARIPNNSQDLFISNVPFAKRGPGQSQKEFGIDFNLHNYFFARAFAKTKPGGLVVFITSNGTMDNRLEQRQALAGMGDLVGAIRLPNTAFKGNASTEVVTDILVFRKPDGNAFEAKNWLHTAQVGTDIVTVKRKGYGESLHTTFNDVKADWVPVDEELRDVWAEWSKFRPKTGKAITALKKALERIDMSGDGIQFEVPVHANEYFLANPDNVIGRHSLGGSMYRADSYTVEPIPDRSDLPAEIRAVGETFPADIIGDFNATESGRATRAAKQADKMGAFVTREGKIWQVEPDGLVSPEWADDPKKVTLFKLWANLRDAYNDLIAAELSNMEESRMEDLRGKLNTAYEAARLINPLAQQRANKFAFLEDDPDYIPLQGLENVTEDVDKKGKRIFRYAKADIFSKRLIRQVSPVDKAETIEDAILASMVEHGRLVPATVAASLNISEAAANARLLESNMVFRNPSTGLLEISDSYLSGNIPGKLNAAVEASVEDPAYVRNVDALRAVLPQRESIGSITANLKSPWLPDEVIVSFAEEVLGLSNVSVGRVSGNVFLEAMGNGVLDYQTEGMSTAKILQRIVSDREIKITHSVKKGDTYVTEVDAAATSAAKEVAFRIRTKFAEWVKTTDQKITIDEQAYTVPEAVENAFNDKIAGWVPPTFRGDWITLPGQSGEIYLDREFRKSVLARMLTLGYGMIAHGVGSGKTLTQVALAMELRRLGKAKKPVIVVEKSTLVQFTTSFRKAYPQAKILVAGKNNFGPQDRARFLARMKAGDWDAVIVTRPQLSKIPNHPSAVRRFMAKRMAELDTAIANSSESGKSDRQSKLQQLRDNLEEKIVKMEGKLAENQDRYGTVWEELGVDAIIVDEAHNFKKTMVITRKQNVKNLPSPGDMSQQALSMEFKTDAVRTRNHGKGVFFATGTPISNTMAEAWVMLNFIAPHILEQNGVATFDEFADTYGDLVVNPEATWKGEVKDITRFAKFVNGRQLVDLIRSVFDVAMGNENLGLDVPKIKGGKPRNVVLPETPSMAMFNDWILDVLVPTYRETFGEKDEDGQVVVEPMEGLRKYIEENKWVTAVPIMTMQAGIAAALDPRMIHDLAPDDPGSKVNTVVQRVIETYRRGMEEKTTQVIFTDLQNPFTMDYLEEFTGSNPYGHLGPNPKTFDIYEDIAKKLVAAGIPREQIGWLPGGKEITDEAKAAFFDKVNDGTVRIVIGGTKIATGVNFQERLAAEWHLMPPRDFKPSMLEQRLGRAIRQGNMHAEWGHNAFTAEVEKAAGKTFTGKHAKARRQAAEKWLDENNRDDIREKALQAEDEFAVIVDYLAMEKSLDSAVYAMMSAKQGFTSQVLSDQVRGDFEDVGDSVSFDLADMAAHTIGDTNLIRKIELDRAIKAMEQERNGLNARRGELTSRIRQTEEYLIPGTGREIANLEQDIATYGNLFARRPGEKEGSAPAPIYELENGPVIDTREKSPKEGGITSRLNGWLVTSWANGKKTGNVVKTSMSINGVEFKIRLEEPLSGTDGIPGYVLVGGEQTGHWLSFTGAASLMSKLRGVIDSLPYRLADLQSSLARYRKDLDGLRPMLDAMPATYPRETELQESYLERARVRNAINAAKAAADAERKARRNGAAKGPTLDPRIAEKFGADVPVDPVFGMPRIPEVLDSDDPLLTSTHELDTVTVEKGEELSRRGILKPGTYPRKKMHEAIVRHILSQGKALPEGMQPTVFFSGGGGGAGKTTILDELKDKNLLKTRGAIEINADDIKALIPEYKRIAQTGDGRAAVTVHEESSVVAKMVIEEVLKPSGMAGWGETAPTYNVIYDATLANFDKVVPILNRFKNAGFLTHLIGVTVDPREAIVRAFLRGANSRRFVHPEILMEAHIGFNKSLPGYLPLFDRVDLYDNTPPKPHPIGRKTDKKEFEISDQVWYDTIGERAKIQNPGSRNEHSGELHAGSQENPREGSQGRRPDDGGNAQIPRSQGQGEVTAPQATPATAPRFNNLRDDLAAQREYFRERMADMGYANEADIDDETFAKWAREWREMNPRNAPDGALLYTPPAADPAKTALERALGELPPLMRKTWAAVLEAKGDPEAAAKATGQSVNAVENIIRIVRGRAIALDRAARGQTVPVKDGKLAAGRPDLALGSNPVVAAVDAARNLEGSPSWRPRDIVVGEASARLAADYQGTYRQMLDKARKLEPMSDTDVATVKLILAKETAAGALEDPTRRMDLAELIHGYREIGSDTARSLAMRFDPHHNPADRAAQFLAEGFLSPDPATRKMMQKAKTAAERQTILQSWMNRVNGINDAMKARGIDVKALLAQHAAVQSAISSTDAANPQAARLYQIQIAKLSPQDRAILETARALQIAGQRDMRLVMARAAAAGAVDETYAVSRYRKFQAELAAEMRAVAKQAAQVALGTPGVTDAEMAILSDIGFGSLDEAYEEDNRPRKTPAKRKPGQAKKPAGPQRPYIPAAENPVIPRMDTRSQPPIPGMEGQPNDIRGTGEQTLDGLRDRVLGPVNELTGDYDLTDPEVLNTIAQALGGARGTWIDGLVEFWKASILSGPKTQIVNVVSTAAYGLYETTIRRAAEGAANDLLKLVGLGSADAATTGELAVIFQHVRQAAGRAIRNGWSAWKTEQRVFNDQALGLARQLDFATVKGEKSQRFQADPTTSLGKLVNLLMAAVRMPSFRLMGMTDEILKTFYGHLEAAAQAHRIARKEGLKGEAYHARHAALMAYGSEAWVKAHGHALKISFQTELGESTDSVSKLIDPIAQLVQSGVQKVPVLQFVIPFITTPTNLAKNAITLSPAGLFFHTVDMVRALKARYGDKEIPETIRRQAAKEIYDRARLISDLTQQLIAWGLAYSLVGMAEDDEEDGLPSLTGSVPAKGTVQRGERDLAARTMPPYHIKLGGYWLDYSRFDPFSTVLAAIADYAHAKRSGKEGAELAAHMIGKTMAAAKDKTFLSGIADLMHAYDDAVAAKSGGYGIQSYLARVATGFVPNLIRQPIQMADPMQRDTRELPADTGFLEGLAIRSGFMLFPQTAPVKLDVWGRPMTRTQAAILGEPGDALLRLTWPGGITANAAEKVLPIDKWILSYQRKRGEGDPSLAFEIPERDLTYTIGGKKVTVSLSREDHEAFIKSAGQDALSALQGANPAAWSDWKNPQSSKAAMVKDVMEDIRAAHRARMRAKYMPEAIKKASEPRK